MKKVKISVVKGNEGYSLQIKDNEIHVSNRKICYDLFND